MNLGNNAFFSCDALTLLERLPSETVALVYLDPPWKTHFGLAKDSHNLSEWSDERYLSYLSKVVQQVRRLLTAKGSLFIHWSPLSPLDMRLVASQAFGDQSRYEITWRRKDFASNISPKIDSEFILVFSKSDTPIYNPIFLPLNDEEKSFYSLMDGQGRFRADSLISPFDRSTMQFEWRGHRPPSMRSWKLTREKLEAYAAEDRIYFPPSSGLPRLKRYFDDHPGREVSITWDDLPSFTRTVDRTGYPGEKPLPLMMRIVELASNAGDLILDPFCGSGATMAAAQQVGRRWWGADSSADAQKITTDRLLNAYDLEALKDYGLFTQKDVATWRPSEIVYRNVITNVSEIATLQSETAALTEHLISLKRLMNINEDDDERVEDAIKQMEHWIATSVANQSKSVDSYIPLVCSWLTGWEKLDKASQLFLPQAELLFDNIARTSGQDYSPFIIQYCRALENELLTKLFASYADDLYGRQSNMAEFLAADIGNKKTGKFAKALQRSENNYTLGDMNFIMGLMKAHGQTLQGSTLLRDFRGFTIYYFSERIVDKSYLDQIEKINRDFRCKAAHPNVLDAEVAERCRQQVRSCLNELILNYRGIDPVACS